MFSFDEQLKHYLLGQLTGGTTAYFLLDRYWNQLVLYLLLGPLQWLHIVHMLCFTYWDQYNALSKTLMVLYVVSCFILWEGVRIALYHSFRAMGTTDVKELAYRVASAAQEVGMEGLARAKPHYDKLHESMLNLATKAKNSLGKLVSGSTAPAAPH